MAHQMAHQKKKESEEEGEVSCGVKRFKTGPP
jgi:hypothetical protein